MTQLWFSEERDLKFRLCAKKSSNVIDNPPQTCQIRKFSSLDTNNADQISVFCWYTNLRGMQVLDKAEGRSDLLGLFYDGSALQVPSGIRDTLRKNFFNRMFYDLRPLFYFGT